MTAKEFYLTVVEMRKAQKMFFKTKDRVFLDKSIKLEKEVDNEIKRVEKILKESESPKLF